MYAYSRYAYNVYMKETASRLFTINFSSNKLRTETVGDTKLVPTARTSHLLHQSWSRRI